MVAIQQFLNSAEFLRFAYLQALDLLSTTAFLRFGVEEANPMVKLSMSIAPSPLSGLLLVKLMAVGLAMVCFMTGREKLISRMNFFFAALVAWNLVCLIAR